MALTLTTADLATFLGAGVDEDRGALVLDLAADLAASIVSPVPEEAKAIVLSSAARGYSNPQGVSQEVVGPYEVQRPWPGVYLTRQERTALKRMADVGGAFSIDTMQQAPTAQPASWWVPSTPEQIEAFRVRQRTAFTTAG